MIKNLIYQGAHLLFALIKILKKAQDNLSEVRWKIIVPHFSGPEDISALCQSLVSCSHNNIFP